MASLNREQIIDILEYVGVSKIINREGKDDIQFCCPVHGESNPSAGISIDKQVFNCFSCHAHGDITWFLYRSLPEEFRGLREVDEWIKDRYGVDFKTFDENVKSKIIRYEDRVPKIVSKRVELPLYKIAPFHSGKSTYKYFFNRGFTKKTMRENLIGYDKENQTVTIPVFYENNALAGIIGRYIDPDRPKNMRYKIYWFSTGEVLYLMQNINYKNKTCILCEGILDALWLQQCGFENALATLTNSVSKSQKRFLEKHFDEVIDFSDGDEMGDIFTERLVKLCGETLKLSSVKHLYPRGCKDPQDCTPSQLCKMLDRKVSINGLVTRKVKAYT